MRNVKFAVVLVYSTSFALRVEKMLQEINIETKLIPVPRHLSSDCGVCVRFPNEYKDRVQTLLDSHQLDFEGVFSL
jgi:hypothetical protein